MQIKASSNSKTETSKRKPAAGHRCAFCLWQARAEDRYCGQCGEELQAIHNSSTTDGDIASPIAGAPACIKCGSAVNSQGTDCSICGLERGPRLYFQKLINRTNPSRLIKLTLLLSVILIAYIAGNQAEPAPVAQIDHSPHALPSETRLNKSIARIEQQIKLAGPGQGRRDLLDECLYLRASVHEQNNNPDEALSDLAQISSDFPDQEQVLAKIISLKNVLSARSFKRESTHRFGKKSKSEKPEKKPVHTQIKPKKELTKIPSEKPKVEPPARVCLKEKSKAAAKPIKKAKAADDQQSYNSFLIRYFKEGLSQQGELKEPPSYEEWQSSKNSNSRSQGSR